jgi:hypothetical protein
VIASYAAAMTISERSERSERSDRQDSRDLPDDDRLMDALFESSPAPAVRTSAAAVAGFDLGLVALVATPFAPLVGLACLAAVLAVVVSVTGLARASRRDVSGGQLAALGLVLALVVALLVGLRYAGIDTTVGPGVASAVQDAVRALATLVPSPR